MSRRRDFLDEMVDESTKENPRFPQLLEAAYEQRKLGRELAERRRRLGLSQTEAALRMGSTQRVVSKLENGGDVNVTTLRRYVAVLGASIRVAPARKSARTPRRA